MVRSDVDRDLEVFVLPQQWLQVAQCARQNPPGHRLDATGGFDVRNEPRRWNDRAVLANPAGKNFAADDIARLQIENRLQIRLDLVGRKRLVDLVGDTLTARRPSEQGAEDDTK